MGESYMDARVCALRDTMICYRDDAVQVRVPARAGDLRLKRLGMGALCCPNLEGLELEEGYERIPAETITRLGFMPGKVLRVSLRLPATLEAVEGLLRDAPIGIAGNERLVRVELARRLPLREYRTFVDTAVPVKGNLRLPVGVVDPHSPCRVLADVLRAGGVGVIEPSNVEFPLFSLDDRGVRPMLFKPRASLTPAGQRHAATENEALLQRIARGQWGARDPDSERWNDRMQQAGEDILGKRQAVAVICLDERSAMRAGGEVRFVLHAWMGAPFSQSLRRVRLDGKDYYVYARQHLQSAGSVPAYLREDVCVYSGDRMLTDPVLSEEVYEKYRLLNML